MKFFVGLALPLHLTVPLFAGLADQRFDIYRLDVEGEFRNNDGGLGGSPTSQRNHHALLTRRLLIQMISMPT